MTANPDKPVLDYAKPKRRLPLAVVYLICIVVLMFAYMFVGKQMIDEFSFLDFPGYYFWFRDNPGADYIPVSVTLENCVIWSAFIAVPVTWIVRRLGGK